MQKFVRSPEFGSTAVQCKPEEPIAHPGYKGPFTGFASFRPGNKVVHSGRTLTVGWVLVSRGDLFVALKETGELVRSDSIKPAEM